MLLAACTLGQLASCAFSSCQADGGNIHEQILRDALRGTVSDTNIEFVAKACDSQDEPGSDGARESRRHFDDCNFAGALGYIDREKKKALNYAAEADADPVSRAHCLRHLGLMLHTVQDFYSRSNYVELQLEDMTKRANPYSIDVVDWSKVPAGYVGKKSGDVLASGYRKDAKPVQGAEGTAKLSYEQLNKDNPESSEGKKPDAGSTLFKVARDLAVRETQRQLNMFEALIRTRYQGRADAIITALHQASPGQISDSE
jgi:hypothetical protein